MMDPKIKADWIAALRSGDYQQCEGTLSDGVGFCCLGVLCEVVKPEGYEAGVISEEHYDEYNEENYTRTETDELTDRIREKIGLGYGDAIELMSMNDEQGKSFVDIADYLEQDKSI